MVGGLFSFFPHFSPPDLCPSLIPLALVDELTESLRDNGDSGLAAPDSGRRCVFFSLSFFGCPTFGFSAPFLDFLPTFGFFH